MDIKSGELASTGDTNNTQLNFTDVRTKGNNLLTHYVRVISGTVKFGIMDAPTTQYAIPTDTPMIFECYNGELYCRQSSAGDTFVVTVSR
jgi:hypothetical protein